MSTTSLPCVGAASAARGARWALADICRLGSRQRRCTRPAARHSAPHTQAQVGPPAAPQSAHLSAGRRRPRLLRLLRVKAGAQLLQRLLQRRQPARALRLRQAGQLAAARRSALLLLLIAAAAWLVGWRLLLRLLRRLACDLPRLLGAAQLRRQPCAQALRRRRQRKLLKVFRLGAHQTGATAACGRCIAHCSAAPAAAAGAATAAAAAAGLACATGRLARHEDSAGVAQAAWEEGRRPKRHLRSAQQH